MDGAGQSENAASAKGGPADGGRVSGREVLSAAIGVDSARNVK